MSEPTVIDFIAQADEALREVESAPSLTDYTGSRVAIARDALRRAITVKAKAKPTGTWSLPAEPGPEVTAVRLDDGRIYKRQVGTGAYGEDRWAHESGPWCDIKSWAELLSGPVRVGQSGWKIPMVTDATGEA